MTTLKTYTLAVFFVAVFFAIGHAMDQPRHAKSERREVAASQVCGGQSYQWHGSTVECFREANEPQYALERAKP